jgi:lipopolysaccharide transport system ATP-binding protein
VLLPFQAQLHGLDFYGFKKHAKDLQMSCDFAIRVENLGKCYEIYATPQDRLKQYIYPKLQSLIGVPTKIYSRKFWAIKDISLYVAKGETVGLIGRNGSGKSTLLQIICGTLSQTSGVVETQGRVAALLELGAGFNPEFTGRENVLLNAAILGFPKDELLQKMGQIIEFSELDEFIDRPVKTYSSGMVVRLAFSTAIHVNPSILIVDEALAVGDAKFQAKCMHKIKAIRQKGASILFVSHDVASVRTLCDRVLWLENGEVVDQGEAFAVTGRYMESMLSQDINGVSNSTVSRATKSKIQLIDPTDNANELTEKIPLQLKLTTDVEQTKARNAKHQLDSRPVAHWGSNKGIILSAALCDQGGALKNVVTWGDAIQIKIELDIPKEISRDHLKVAFSIKDMKGTDLVVSVTNDSEIKLYPGIDRFDVSFRMTNLLVAGMYVLVAAVENRQGREIHYYEYIEGTHYFSSIASENFVGVFQPEIKQFIQIRND